MDRAQDRDSGGVRERLAAAYDRCGASLYRYALMIVADHSSAEDAVQQAFAKLAGMGGRVAELASVENYLRIAVRNECYRILEGRGSRASVELKDQAILEPVDAGLVAEDERRAIEAALRALPVEQREVVHLKVYEGMTFGQIAELLQVPMNTAASRYRYAMEKLRDLLGDV